MFLKFLLWEIKLPKQAIQTCIVNQRLLFLLSDPYTFSTIALWLRRWCYIFHLYLKKTSVPLIFYSFSPINTKVTPPLQTLWLNNQTIWRQMCGLILWTEISISQEVRLRYTFLWMWQSCKRHDITVSQLTSLYHSLTARALSPYRTPYSIVSQHLKSSH